MKKQIEDARTFSLDNNKQKGLAIIIAGASLSEIQSNEELSQIFLEAADNAKVVLACRVSPA